MKLPWDKKYIVKGIIAFIVIAASITFFMMMNKWTTFSGFLSLLNKSVRPITYGLILAYLLNPLVHIIEKDLVLPIMKKVFRKNQKRAEVTARGISITASWIIVFIMFFALVDLVVPQLFSSIESLTASLPSYVNKAFIWISELLEKNPEVVSYLQQNLSGFTTDLEKIFGRITSIIPNIQIIITEVFSNVFDLFVAILNILVGVIVSVYVLKDKEKFTAQFKKLLYGYVSTGKANATISFLRLMHSKFGNFITGKIFDSLIIGILCFIILSIVKIPYAALVSVVVGVTNVIPFFGPFIGAIPSSILILLAEPVKCIYFVIIIFLLQQFDGNILGPRILGSSTGVSGFWVMFSILVGSSLFGIWGMVIAVPLFAVIYTLLKRRCAARLSERGINFTTEEFQNIDHISEKTKKPVFFNEALEEEK